MNSNNRNHNGCTLPADVPGVGIVDFSQRGEEWTFASYRVKVSPVTQTPFGQKWHVIFSHYRDGILFVQLDKPVGE